VGEGLGVKKEKKENEKRFTKDAKAEDEESRR